MSRCTFDDRHDHVPSTFVPSAIEPTHRTGRARVPEVPRRISHLDAGGEARHLRSTSERQFEPRASIRCTKRGGHIWLIFDARDVGRFWAADKYTWFWWAYRPESGLQLCDTSLVTLEQRLSPLGFVRVHRRELVNLRFIRRLHLQANGGGLLTLWDGQTLQCSRRATRRLRRRLAGHTPSRPLPHTPTVTPTKAQTRADGA